MSKTVCYYLSKKNKNKLNLNKKQENSKLFYRKDLDEHDYDFQNMIGWPNYPNYCYATVVDGKIVSCASAGYQVHKIDDRIVDISTNTNKMFQRKGYSVSNVVALCEYILNIPEEKEIYYKTDKDNIASQKTAESAGLVKISFCYILFRKLKNKIMGK